MGSDIGQAVGSGVVGQWAASFDGDPTGMTNHQKLSQEAEGWHRRMAGALISGPAVIALAALARGIRGLAVAYGIATVLRRRSRQR